MDRRSFLKMIFAAIMTPFLPKGNQEEETAFTADEYFLPLDWTIDPVEALIEPYPTLAEALEEIRRICCDPDLWKKPIERTVIMSPGDYKWCSARLEGVTWTPVDDEEL